jgi:hypothetical protein
VRAAVVARVDVVAVREERERVAVEVDDEPAGGAQLLERGGPDEGRSRSARSYVTTLCSDSSTRIGRTTELRLVHWS